MFRFVGVFYKISVTDDIFENYDDLIALKNNLDFDKELTNPNILKNIIKITKLSDQKFNDIISPALIFRIEKYF